MASQALISLRNELAMEQAHLSALEEDVELKAAQLGFLHEEYISNMERIAYFYQPQLLPRLALVMENTERRNFVQSQILWLEKKLVEQEKRLRVGTFVEARDMLPYAEEEMKPAKEALRQVYEAFDRCATDALKTMSHYSCPPETAMETMRMVLRVRGEQECSWAASQVLLTNNYFKDFFVNRSETMLKMKDVLEEDVMEELERYCEKPEHAVQELYKVSEPIGVFGQWLRAIRDFYRIRYYTAPVLFSNTGREHVRKATEALRRLTFGVTSDRVTQKVSSAANSVKSSIPLEDHDGPSHTQAKIRELRHFMHEVEEHINLANTKVEEVREQINQELKELRENYDSTMLPIEYQLEDKTASFTSLLALM